MYEPQDFLLHGLVIVAVLAQILPVFFALRVYRMTEWVKYWSHAWVVFIVVMLWIMLRRAIVAWTFDPLCEPKWEWIFDQIISTIVTSGLFTAFSILQYECYRYWFQTAVLKGGEEDLGEKKERG